MGQGPANGIEAAAIAAGVDEKTIRGRVSAGKLTRYERPGRIGVLVDAAELSELVKPKPNRRR
jgi:hypothetical protein